MRSNMSLMNILTVCISSLTISGTSNLTAVDVTYNTSDPGGLHLTTHMDVLDYTDIFVSMDVSDFLIQQFRFCGLDDVILLSDEHLDISALKVLEKLLAWKIPLIHVEVSADWLLNLDDFFLEFYWQRQAYNYVVVSNRYNEIVSRSYQLFLQRSEISLAFQNVKFAVVVPQEARQSSIRIVMNEFDNVAILFYASSTLSLAKASTLMWRENRSRSFDDVTTWATVRLLSKHHKCLIFPNIAHKLNGRVLRAHTKEYSYYVRKINYRSEFDNEPLYEGFVIDIVDLLASSLNFSYVMIPDMETAGNTTWEEQLAFIAAGKAEFSMPGWMLTSEVEYNYKHAVTYPIYVENFRAMYSDNNKKESLGLGLGLTNLFQDDVEFALLGSFILTLLISTLIRTIWNHWFNKTYSIENENDSPQPNTNSTETLNNRDSINTELRKEIFTSYGFDIISDKDKRPTVYKEDSKGCNMTIKTNKLTLFGQTSDMFFGLIGSILQQGSLPNVRLTSVRVLLWAWSLAALVFVSLYKGVMTADRIQSREASRFSDLQDMLDSGIDVCVSDTSVTYLKTMENSSNQTLLNKLYRKTQEYKRRHPTKCTSVYSAARLLKDKEDVMVLGVPSSVLYILKNQSENVKFIPENLLTGPFGIPTPNGSEINRLFSVQLIQFWDQGTTDYLYRKWTDGQQCEQDNMSVDKDKNRKLSDFTSLFYWCGLGIALSTFIFIIEHGFITINKFARYLNAGNNSTLISKNSRNI